MFRLVGIGAQKARRDIIVHNIFRDIVYGRNHALQVPVVKRASNCSIWMYAHNEIVFFCSQHICDASIFNSFFWICLNQVDCDVMLGVRYLFFPRMLTDKGISFVGKQVVGDILGLSSHEYRVVVIDAKESSQLDRVLAGCDSIKIFTKLHEPGEEELIFKII